MEKIKKDYGLQIKQKDDMIREISQKGVTRVVMKASSTPKEAIAGELKSPSSRFSSPAVGDKKQSFWDVTTVCFHDTPFSYPKAPISDMVFIPLLLYLKAVNIFECVNHGKEARFVAKQGGEIDDKSPAMGNVQEVRHVFARIVFDPIYSLDLDQN
ncbi:Poly A polymerase, head domain-containing protein [Artemisia annua]|uniref:Poly A polymerase, head domain-containing protein n=1 Tax=Artemisia annua TaxID=35608 RepID=A0A2U1L2J5_ARTAN|nr:Poly A polymerase, head domain-containing protein [Artemisia annua]